MTSGAVTGEFYGTGDGSEARRLLVWGTYDLGKPRTRIVLAALRQAGFSLDEIHRDVWRGVADKSQQRGGGWAARALATMLAWPVLVWRYCRAPDHALVVVPYMGTFDVLVLWFFARLRGKKIVWDAFLSLYDTVVTDRRMLSPRNPLARLLWLVERLACRAASRVVLDTRSHAALFASLYGVSPDKLAAVMVGAEREAFTPRRYQAPTGDLNVLFYGQFIPLHGIETIVRAAALGVDKPIRWTVIGKGQEAGKMTRMLEQLPLPRLEWIKWVPYEQLSQRILQTDVCLGIFGKEGKALRVIPNKVFQVLSAGRPLITGDTPAMRELIGEGAPGVWLVPPGDPAALLEAIEQCRADLRGLADQILHDELRARFSLEQLACEWAKLVAETCDRTALDQGSQT